ncbi:MAG: CopG family transcriptional regulator [Elusimicrobia bacterium RIFOXYD2_FULL_34_15]|nr:MAG: CopG family transcriptional regulator [Elusimicrobia bacterium RIFOXYD2_FULL_34_15]
MRRMINNDMPIGKMVRVKDKLPSPEELVISEEKVKVTISLSKTSIEYFKKEAKHYHTKYQKMIRNLLDKYALQHSH